jgi:hypothetical protein
MCMRHRWLIIPAVPNWLAFIVDKGPGHSVSMQSVVDLLRVGVCKQFRWLSLSFKRLQPLTTDSQFGPSPCQHQERVSFSKTL